jgi:hypothetical protein
MRKLRGVEQGQNRRKAVTQSLRSGSLPQKQSG